MKKEIHPESYRLVAFKDMSNDDIFITKSTVETKETIEVEGVEYPLVKLEISRTSHPYYTGKSKLIDTAGRLHTSSDLMRELAKVVSVTRKRAGDIPVSVVLVIDATTGQNGLNQAKEFNDALSLDGLIVTKLDGTAKGGIALAISNQLNLPIYRIGVGESIDDLQTFDARSFCEALVGEGVQ